MRCYYCGKSRCQCELPRLNFTKMRIDVTRAFRNGTKYDRDMLNAEQLRALLKVIAEKDQIIEKLKRSAC